MKKRVHQPAQTAKDLLTDLRHLVVEAEEMAANTVTEYSQEALDSMRARYESAQQRLSELYDGTKKKVAAGAHYTDEAIREKPYHAIAIAAGVAIVVGLLLGRSSRK